MNARQMALALRSFGSLMGGRDAFILDRFSHAFEDVSEAKTPSIVAQVAKNWKTEKRPARQCVELADALERIRKTLESAGAKSQAGVFAKVLQLFTGSENQDVDGFVRDVLDARVKKVPAPKPPKANKVKFTDLAPDIARRLTAAAYERSRFDSLLSDLEGSHTAAELKLIADNFVGFDIGKKKKNDIIKVVRNWQREEELNKHNHTIQQKAGL